MTEVDAVRFERGLARIRIAGVVVAVDVAAIQRFLDRGGAADVVLADVLGLAPTGDRSVVELRHSGGQVALAIHGTIRIRTGRVVGSCQRPTFIAGAFRRSCLRGVVHQGSELVYVLDVDALAARTSQSLQEQQPCASD